MPERFPLDVMYEEAKDAVLTLQRKLACGEESDMAVTAVLQDLSQAYRAIKGHPLSQPVDSLDDYDKAHILMNHAFCMALRHFRQHKNEQAARKVFKSKVAPLFQRRLWN